jgi:hypothetical protein
MNDARQAALQNIFDSARAQVSEQIAASSRELSSYLNGAARSLTAAENEAAWRETFLDAISRFAKPCALYRREGGKFLQEGARGIDAPDQVDAADAPAIAQAVDSGETSVVALAAGEVSGAVARASWGAKRIYIFPLAGPVPAAMLTTPPSDVAAAELLTTVASLAVSKFRRLDSTLVNVSSAQAKPSWEELPRAVRELHLRAQRFARVRVAEWQMARAATIEAARASHSLYNALRPQIDAAREQFQTQFSPDGGMPDYLHLEILRTLAGDDETVLGADYPGPLV